MPINTRIVSLLALTTSVPSETPLITSMKATCQNAGNGTKQSCLLSHRAFTAPEESYAVAFHYDYGKFLRGYYAEYVRILRDYATENGIHDTPFFINIHGTGNGRIFDYPLGVSQLYEAINQGNGFISGTDVYLGEPQEGTYQDLYVANAVTDCMNKKENPLTSIEFECGDGDYCGLSGCHYHPGATSHKMLECLSQNTRMLSFYLFSGGVNYPLQKPEDDGNGRMAFTGELHGMNAPVQPDGSHNYSFDRIAHTARTIHALNSLIASSHQETDGVTMGFIPDYFLTELTYPLSAATSKIFENLKTFRCADRIDSIARGLLSNGIYFDAADIGNEAVPSCKLLFVLSARYMPNAVQKKLLSFVQKGGTLLLYGELPEYGLEGNPCTLLKDSLGLDAPMYLKNEEPSFYLTINAAGHFEGKVPAQRATLAQCFPADSDTILSPNDSNLMCGFLKKQGTGTVCAITADYPAAMDFYKLLWETIGIKGALSAPCSRQGLYLSSTVSDDGQRLLYLLNLDVTEKTTDITLHGKILFHNFLLVEKASLILPVNVRAGKLIIEKSTAQIAELRPDGILFYLSQRGNDQIVIKDNCSLAPSADYLLTKEMGCTIVTPTDRHADSLFLLYSK